MSQRKVAGRTGHQLAYGSWYEAENVLAEVTEADLLFFERDIGSPSIKLRRLAGRALRRAGGAGVSLPARPGATGLDAEALDDHYDLAICMPFTQWDLPLLEELGDLRRRVDQVVVYFPEIWPVDTADPRLPHEPWHLVDDIFVAIQPTVEALSAAIGREVHYLPMAADVHAFRPHSLEDPRPIDVLNIGRRIPELHEALYEWAYRTRRFYRYDTFSVAAMDDPIRHRLDLGQRYQRTSVAICSYPKHDLPEVNQGRRIIPQRLWEGLASGTVMVGMPPEEQLQRIAVGEVVVEDLPSDPDEAVAAIEKLVDSDTTQIRHRNLQLALRRHDWVHRWLAMFDTLGLETPPLATNRASELGKLADSLA